MNSQTFLEELYPDKPDDAFILLWKNKKSTWFTDITKAADHINKTKEDIYYGVGLSPKNFGSNKRCKANKISGIPGFYADIDIGKGSKEYPPTTKDAMSLVSGDEFKPTMVVSSGNGLHAYWLFKELWMFENDEERKQAADLNRRINYLIKKRATKQGWNVDNVSDLARILRPVGSINCKKKSKPVAIITNNGPRYSDTDYFEKFLPNIDEYDIQPQHEISAKELSKIEKIINLKITAEPPQANLDMLLEADPYFKALWQKSKDAKKDTSTSGFHMSLANLAAKASWGNQEITNLLIAWNRRHGIDLKKLMSRPDYIAATIARARKNASGFLAEQYADELDALSGTEYQDALEEANKKKALELISHHLGFKTFEIIKYVQEKKSKYVMKSAKGSITFIGPEELSMKSKFEQRILASTNKAISLSRKNFEVVKSTYEYIIKNVIVSKESSVKSRMKAWIIEYLDGKPHLDQHESVIGNKPFVHNKQWFIYHTSFKEWTFRTRHDREGIDKTEFDLKRVGAEERQFNPRHPLAKDGEDKRTRKRPWAVPINIIEPP